MSDIITRLLLKTNDFDANLNKSKQSVNSFQGDISGMASRAGTGVMKFAGAIGLAAGAYETFDKLIHSSQGTQDAFEWRMSACKESVDMFFHSLSSGDFSAFNRGIKSAYDDLIKFQQLRDDFADAKVSNNVYRAQYQSQSQELKAIISDNNSTKTEKKKASDSLRKLTESYSRQLTSTNDLNIAQMLQNVQTKTGRYYSKDDIIRFFKVYNNPASLDNRKYGFDSYVSKMNELKKNEFHYEAREVGGGSNKAVIMQKVTNPEVTSQIKQLQKENNELDRMYTLSQHNDKTWEELSSSVIEYFGAQAESAQNLNFLVKQQNKVDKANGGDIKDIAPSGSIAYFDAELSKKNKELINATTAQARAAVQIAIDELEAKKLNLKIKVEKDVFETIHGKAKGGELKNAGFSYKNSSNLSLSDYKKTNGKSPKVKSPISKKDIKLNEDFNESLSAMGDIMSSLSGSFDGNTQSILQWGSTLLSTIGQTISAIQSAIPAKKASAAASKEEATAEMVDGAAKTVNAHASIPFAGIAIGLAGVASIVAVLTNMPKFANGGFVPGNSFSGDNVLARVNSGEMILNKEQQGNLFDLLNSGIYGGLTPSMINTSPQYIPVSRNISTSDPSSKIELYGDIRIKGSDLKLALNNYNHKKSKVQ